jgi:ribose transport system ATP-binding protein
LDRIIRLMVGRDIREVYPRRPHRLGRAILEFRALAGVTKPRAVSLTLREGEILGVAGLIGAGRTETLRAVFGLDRIAHGTVLLDGRETTHAHPGQRLRQGLGLLSENRKEEGLMLERSLAENLTLTRLGPATRFGYLSRRRQHRLASEWISRLGVRARDASQPANQLSGGNQQKVALGRLLHHDARILLLDEPTRGIDVGSKVQIYELMGELAAAGKAVVFVSSYLPELLGVCDTIGVMCRGLLSRVLPADQWTEHSLICAALGQTEDTRDVAGN